MFKRCLVTLVLALFASMLVTACGQDTNKKTEKKAVAQPAQQAEDAAKKAEKAAKDAAAATKDAAVAAKDAAKDAATAAKDAAAAAKDAAGAAKDAAKKPVQGIPLPDNF